MKSTLFAFCFFIIFGAGCAAKDELTPDIFGTWSVNEIEKNNETSGLLRPVVRKEQSGALLAVFPDGKYTDISTNGSYRTGNWEQTGPSSIDLITKSKGRLHITCIQSRDNTEDPYLVMNVPGRNAGLNFTKIFDTIADLSQEPFHPINNEWRKKATHPENQDELKKRLLNHLRHFCFLLKRTVDEDNSTLDTRYSLGPVQVYNKAIGARPFEKISKNWINCFYTEDEAKTAAGIFENFVTTYKYNGKRAADWIKQDYYILTSICSAMQ
jgi:hypothetical protein